MTQNESERVECSACGGTGRADNQPDPMPCLTCRGYGRNPAPVPVAPASDAFREWELSSANAEFVRPILPHGEPWELTPEEAAELEALMGAPRGAPGTLRHEPKPVREVDVFELMRENARLRAALEPFARCGRGLPGNWPPQCPYTTQTYPPEGPATQAYPSYDGEDLASPWLLTIGDLYAAARVYDAVSEPGSGE
jgi:hypothetical protein